MWTPHRSTANGEDNNIYKEAFNQATIFFYKFSKNQFKQLAYNIKHHNKSLYAYLRSNIKARISSRMTKELKEAFVSVFTMEDTKSRVSN